MTEAWTGCPAGNPTLPGGPRSSTDRTAEERRHLKLAIEGGVNLIGCQMTVDLFGFTRDDFIPEVKEFVGELEGAEAVYPKMVFDPPWSPDMMSEDAKFALGF